MGLSNGRTFLVAPLFLFQDQLNELSVGVGKVFTMRGLRTAGRQMQRSFSVHVATLEPSVASQDGADDVDVAVAAGDQERVVVAVVGRRQAAAGFDQEFNWKRSLFS